MKLKANSQSTFRSAESRGKAKYGESPLKAVSKAVDAYYLTNYHNYAYGKSVRTSRMDYANPPSANAPRFSPPFENGSWTRSTGMEPEIQFIPFGRRDTIDQVIHQINIDFEKIEKEVLAMFGFGKKEEAEEPKVQSIYQQARAENTSLSEWLEGDRPSLKVRLYLTEQGLHARHGTYGLRSVGEDTTPLEKIGYRFTVQHRRDYYDARTDEVVRLRPQEVSRRIPSGAVFFYVGSQEVEEFDTEPFATGGDTVVRIMAPSGHWAEGHAVCADDDPFDRQVGRNIAMERALAMLNEVVNG